MRELALKLGFIGLGVMGGPMCSNMARKHAGQVLAFDLNPDCVKGVVDAGAVRAESVGEIAGAADILFLSLPGNKQVSEVCFGRGGILEVGKTGQTVVDLSTTAVDFARDAAARLGSRGIDFADAPVARTREAAQKGTLSIMVGASHTIFERIAPLLRYIGTDVTHCGDVGAGQFVKLANNTLVFEHTTALAELIVIARRVGVDAGILLDTVSKGSGDSFVLRNHGMKAMLPRAFPDKSFPSEYVLKDLAYILELARGHGVPLRMAERAKEYYHTAVETGYGGRYFPIIVDMIDEQTR